MENEIEVGEYIRTDKGNVGKIIEIRLGKNTDTKEFQNIYKLDTGLWTVRKYIVNHSDNSRDLIVVGDLVKMKDSEGEIHWFEVYDNSAMYQYEMLEIVTKEKMENESYKIQ